jgi:C-terminal processing protease CtpA/Prc
MRIPLLVLAALAVSTTAAAQADPPGGIVESAVIEQPPATSWLGMSMQQQARVSELLGRDVDPPVITGVAAGSPAEAAGLRVGDQIVLIDDCDTRESCVNWRRLAPGQRYRLRVRTGAEERDVVIVPAAPRGESRGF